MKWGDAMRLPRIWYQHAAVLVLVLYPVWRNKRTPDRWRHRTDGDAVGGQERA